MQYDAMIPFDWSQLLDAWHDKRKAVFWTTTPLDSLLEKGLHDRGLAFVPHYASPTAYTFVDIPFCDGKRRASIRVRRVPEEHLELRAFCQRVQDELRLKLF